MNGARNLHPVPPWEAQHGRHQVPAPHECAICVCFSPAPGPAAPELRRHGDGQRSDCHLAHLARSRRIRPHGHRRHWHLAGHPLWPQRAARRVSTLFLLIWLQFFLKWRGKTNENFVWNDRCWRCELFLRKMSDCKIIIYLCKTPGGGVKLWGCQVCCRGRHPDFEFIFHFMPDKIETHASWIWNWGHAVSNQREYSWCEWRRLGWQKLPFCQVVLHSSQIRIRLFSLRKEYETWRPMRTGGQVCFKYDCKETV